jgi:hypothetical protein
VLRQIAGTMIGVLRDYDLAGRFGGEEFVMLLPQTRAVDAFRIAERVRAHVSRLSIHAGGTAGSERVPVTVSIGVAALDAGSRRELTELIAAADAALYRAKASGRDQVQMISTSRGLSAVRPPGDDDLSTGIGAPWSGGLWPANHQMPAGVLSTGVLSTAGLSAGALSAGAVPAAGIPARIDARPGEDADAPAPSGEPQLPVEGSASTATTSAVAV